MPVSFTSAQNIFCFCLRKHRLPMGLNGVQLGYAGCQLFAR